MSFSKMFKSHLIKGDLNPSKSSHLGPSWMDIMQYLKPYIALASQDLSGLFQPGSVHCDYFLKII